MLVFLVGLNVRRDEIGQETLQQELLGDQFVSLRAYETVGYRSVHACLKHELDYLPPEVLSAAEQQEFTFARLVHRAKRIKEGWWVSSLDGSHPRLPHR